MKKFLLLTIALVSVQLLLAQKNEVSLSFSNQFWNATQIYDATYAEQEFSLGLEYRRQMSKRFDAEMGVLYSEYLNQFGCPTCDVILPAGYDVHELGAKIGVRWRVLENNRWMIYTSMGTQTNLNFRSLKNDYPEGRKLSTSIYHDLGLRYKVNKNVSFDVEFKTQYNLTDYSDLLKSRTNYGAGVRLSYSF